MRDIKKIITLIVLSIMVGGLLVTDIINTGKKQNSCRVYQKQADELFNQINDMNLNKENENVSIDKIQAYSLYADSLMKRYELCLK